MVKNVLLLLYIACVWAFVFIFIKVEEVAQVGSITVVAGRALIAFVCLFAASLILKKDLLGNVKHIGKFLVFSLLGIVGLWVPLALGQEYINAGLASVMVTSVPLMTFIILVFILRDEPFSWTGLGGLLLGVIGIVFVVELKNILSGGSTLGGFVTILSGQVLFTISGILIGRWARGIDPVVVTTYLLGLGGIMLLALAFIFESPITFPITKKTVFSELAMGVISTASGYFGYYYLIHKAGAYFSTFVFYFLPVFGLLAGYLIFGERVSVFQVMGVGLVFAGVYIINWQRARGK